MRAVAQRVGAARVEVDGECVGQIGAGLLVYVGVGRDDTQADVTWMAQKLAALRVFQDDQGKMSRAVGDVGGGILVVSQFTLFGDTRKGNRPSFDDAAPPEQAQRLLDALLGQLRERGLTVASGRFRAMMQVHATIDGPVTILIDSKKAF